MPCQDGNLVVMSFETIEFFVRLAHIKHFDFLVLTTCEEPVTIHWVPPDLRNRVVMGRDCVDSFAAGAWIPNLNEVVFTTCDNQRFERVPVAGFYVAAVVGEH